MGTLDFFLLESTEYLEQLDALAQNPAGAPPTPDDFLRLTRAFRGSALMASQHPMGRAAQGLESVARALREGRLKWDKRIRGDVIRGIDDCKILLRRLRSPEQGDSERAEQIGATLDRLSGRASAAMRAAAGPGLDAGGRAFVAREAAAIASTLQRAATTLGSDPANRDVLNSVTPSMSALRGVAAIQDLPPLADLLAANEAAVKEVAALRGPAPAAVADVFDSGARALARAAREVVDHGRPDPDSQDAQQFAQRLLATFAGGRVVPVESLFYADQGPHIVAQGSPPESPAAPAYERVELVSHGEFLTAAVAELRRAAASPVQCDLRLFTIAARLRPLAGATGSRLAAALGHLSEATRDAIGRGGAADALDEFVSLISHAADALASAPGGADDILAERLERAAEGLGALAAVPVSIAAGPARSTRPVSRTIPAVQRAAPLPAPHPAAPAPAAPVRPAATAPAPAPTAATVGGDDIATSYLTLEQLIAERGLPLTSIDELVAAPTPMPAAARAAAAQPAAARAGRATGPRAMVEEPAGEGVVPVDALVYRGERALRRALELKSDVDALATSAPDDPRLPALLREVFDLVELGLEPGR